MTSEYIHLQSFFKYKRYLSLVECNDEVFIKSCKKIIAKIVADEIHILINEDKYYEHIEYVASELNLRISNNFS